ncbi:MAG: hypothetical protein V3V08_25765 [Nannocystaceae bacterium]
MKLPRKGVLLRVVIYGGLIGYLGWQAIEHYLLQEVAKIPTFEITPEEAKALYGIEFDENGNIKTRPIGTGDASSDAPTGAEPH